MLKGQTIIEYIMLIGIVTIALFAMSVSIRRGTQSVVRGVADQLALQQNAEQDFSSAQSHMEGMESHVMANNARNTSQLNYRSDTTVNESTILNSFVQTNMGFTPDQNVLPD